MSVNRKVEKDKNQHIQVYVRCRPANVQEKESLNVIETSQSNREVILKERIGNKEMSKKFTFDKVFGPNSTQVDVYRAVAGPMIEEVLTGYNCTVFAYGQTGTGKTYTMEGAKSGSLYTWDTDPKSGIIPRTFHHLFDVLGEQELEYNVRVSYLELYNEELFDLLGPFQEMPKLRLYEDSSKKGSVVIQGLSEIIVHNKDEVYHILERGAERKRMAFTQMNDASSRSHTVFSITVHIKESTSEGEDLVKIGKLNLVDLAGSECIGRSGAVDKRAREAGNINQSLLTLGRVITALVEKAPHIPYRESKLTRLLQDSLGGRTKTSIIATISPSSLNSEETSSTLEYAHRAKNITNKPEVNQKMTKRTLIKEYTEEIERLRRDLLATREKNGIFVDEENYNAMRAKLSNQSEAINEKLAQIEALKEQIALTQALFSETKDQLQTRTMELHNTKDNLQKKERQLRHREAALRQAEFEREEQKHLVSKQNQTEKCLSSQALELLEVAEKTTSDLTGLFSKLDRKTNVECTNQGLFKDLQRNVTQEIESLKSIMLQIIFNQDRQLQNIKESHDTGISELKCQFSKQSESLDQLVMDGTTYISSSHNNQLQLKQQAQKNVEDMLALNKQNKLEFQAHIQDIHNRNNEMIAKIDLLHRSHSQQVTNLSETMVDGFKLIYNFISKTEINLNKEIAEIKETLEVTERLSEETSRRSEEAFQALLAAADQYHKQQEETYKINKYWKEKALSVASGLEAVKNECSSNLFDAVKILDTDLTGKLCSLEKNLTTDKASLTETAVGCQTRLGALEGHLEQYSQKHGNLLTVHKDTVETELDSSSQETLDYQAALHVKKKENEETVAKYEELKTDFKENHDRFVDRLIQDSKEGYDVVSSNVSRLGNMVNNFVEKDIKVDIPTGFTPVRKDYEFPRQLVSTGPHEKILEDFRRILDPSTALGISVPDSPLKEDEAVTTDHLMLKPPELNYESDASDSTSGSSDIKENKGQTKVAFSKNVNKYKFQKNRKLPLRSPNE